MSNLTESSKVTLTIVGAMVIVVAGGSVAWGRLEGRVTNSEQRTERLVTAYTGHVAQAVTDKDKAFELLKDISDRLARLEGAAGLTVPKLSGK